MPLEHADPSRLDGQLAALESQLGLALTTAERERLLTYMAMIQRWTKVYNLTAVRDTGEMFTHHLLDCLAAMPPLHRHLAARTGMRLLDVGSGAGLPGVVIAAISPSIDVTCVESVGKKAAFVQQVAAELGLSNLHAVHARVERLDALAFDIVTSRAFASLADFVSVTLESDTAPPPAAGSGAFDGRLL